jgi:hypothetical protein
MSVKVNGGAVNEKNKKIYTFRLLFIKTTYLSLSYQNTENAFLVFCADKLEIETIVYFRGLLLNRGLSNQPKKAAQL